jgi:hypothetical protein
MQDKQKTEFRTFSMVHSKSCACKMATSVHMSDDNVHSVEKSQVRFPTNRKENRFLYNIDKIDYMEQSLWEANSHSTS